jgi:hypothetical protein
MNRRGFLKSILAAGVAPYVVTSAGVLMPLKQIIVPARWEFTIYGTNNLGAGRSIQVKFKGEHFGWIGEEVYPAQFGLTEFPSETPFTIKRMSS